MNEFLKAEIATKYQWRMFAETTVTGCEGAVVNRQQNWHQFSQDAKMHETLPRESRGVFAAKCFSIHRKESDTTSSFHCKELHHPDSVIAVEFSDDGTLLASGGCDKIVRLWPNASQTEVGRDQNAIMAPAIEMETEHQTVVYGLAFAPDNRRFFSAGLDGKIFIHDVQT